MFKYIKKEVCQDKKVMRYGGIDISDKSSSFKERPLCGGNMCCDGDDILC